MVQRANQHLKKRNKPKSFALPIKEGDIFRVVRIAKVTDCPHLLQRAYARGMCRRCYNKYGRTKLATGCPHKTRLMFCKKLCKSCFLRVQRYN